MRKMFAVWSMCVLTMLGFGQNDGRYMDEVFDDVSVTSDVLYAANISVLTGAPLLDSLFLDVYEPVGDTMAARPLILIAPTGNYLPPILNRSPFGTKTDSANVELATRLAQSGYVVASFEYRLGWNPLPTAPDEVRRSTLLQAAYRSFLDAKAAIRFFRMTAAEMGNPYGVDVEKIAVGGLGTGGYCALGAAYLDSLNEINLQKFIDLSDPANPVPYVIPERDGNFDGTDSTALNLPNHPDYASDFNVVFHMGGALGDSSWIQPDNIPSISLHGVNDPYAPFAIGNVIVPTTGDIVIPTAAGGGKVAEINTRNGNNQLFVKATFDDEITPIANQNNDGSAGLFAFEFPEAPEDSQCVTSIPGFPLSEGEVNSGPWSWYNEAAYIAGWNFFFADAITAGEEITGEEENCGELLTSAPNDPDVARAYIDTSIRYLRPRLAIALDLATGGTIISIENELLSRNLTIYPNPANEAITLSLDATDNIIEEVALYDMTGKVMYKRHTLGTHTHHIARGSLPSGLYVVKVQAKRGVALKKVHIQ